MTKKAQLLQIYDVYFSIKNAVFSMNYTIYLVNYFQGRKIT